VIIIRSFDMGFQGKMASPLVGGACQFHVGYWEGGWDELGLYSCMGMRGETGWIYQIKIC
jgi:hypothetical protein